MCSSRSSQVAESQEEKLLIKAQDLVKNIA